MDPVFVLENWGPATMNILVLCTGNSARSILLESIFNLHGAGHITAYSAGSKPAGRVHPDALALLASKGYPTDGLRSKSWDEFEGTNAPVMDIVITVCSNAANEVCPIWPGAPVTGHWGVPDPACVGDYSERMAALETAYDRLKERANAFLQLDAAVVSGEQLNKHLKEIGQI